LGFVVALTLEAGQLVLKSRTAALTDVYVETFGAWVGSVITRKLCVSEQRQREPLHPDHWVRHLDSF
jgi:glycopeptide antibiotics resistance protein